MSLLADTAQVVSGALVARIYPGLGVRGADVPSTGTNGPALLYNDLVLPAENDDEFIAFLLTSPPGTFTLYENSSFEYSGSGGSGTYRGLKNGVTYGDIAFTMATGVVAPLISVQPQSTSVTDGAMAAFSVTAAGTAPLSYQWRSGGAPISGATSASYSRPAVLADNGALISVVVSNVAGSVTSNNATLSVAAVGAPPRMADPTIIIPRGEWNLSAYRYRKQPREVKDIVIDMDLWFAGRADDPASVSFVASDAAITPTVVLSGNRINIAIAGGVDGASYNLSVLMTTNATPAIVREFDIFVDVIEVT